MSNLSERLESALSDYNQRRGPLNKGQIEAFLVAFEAGCEAKADEDQALVSQLERQIHGIPEDADEFDDRKMFTFAL